MPIRKVGRLFGQVERKAGRGWNQGRVGPGRGQGQQQRQSSYPESPPPGHRDCSVLSSVPAGPLLGSLGAAWVLHGIRHLLFPYLKETLGSFPVPAGYRGSHLRSTVLLSAGED